MRDYLRGLYKGSDQSSVWVMCWHCQCWVLSGDNIRQWEMWWIWPSHHCLHPALHSGDLPQTLDASIEVIKTSLLFYALWHDMIYWYRHGYWTRYLIPTIVMRPPRERERERGYLIVWKDWRLETSLCNLTFTYTDLVQSLKYWSTVNC